MGSNEFLALLLEWPAGYVGAFASAVAMSVVLSQLTRARLLGGLLPYYGYLIVNVASMLFLWWVGTVSSDRIVHFLVTESIMYFVIALLYVRTAPTLVRCAMSASDRSVTLVSAVTVTLLLLSAFYTSSMITEETSSRVEYQLTSSAFTFIKPFTYFAFATAAFLPFLQIRRRMPFSLTVLTLGSMVLFSITAQSKGAFAVGILAAYLLLREQRFFDAPPKKLRSGVRNTALVSLLVAAFVLNLYLLDIDPAIMLIRVIYSSDSIFMTYPYPEPAQLCASVDWLSAYHRGLARALQLPAATDPTTIFGVRLVQNVEIEDTLRGPNARVSSYSLCNFGMLSTVPFVLYLTLLLILQRKLALAVGRRLPGLRLMTLPFLVSIFIDGAQDVYKIMTGFTILVVVWLLAYAIPPARAGRSYGNTAADHRHPHQGSET